MTWQIYACLTQFTATMVMSVVVGFFVVFVVVVVVVVVVD